MLSYFLQIFAWNVLTVTECMKLHNKIDIRLCTIRWSILNIYMSNRSGDSIACIGYLKKGDWMKLCFFRFKKRWNRRGRKQQQFPQRHKKGRIKKGSIKRNLLFYILLLVSLFFFFIFWWCLNIYLAWLALWSDMQNCT